MIRLFAICLLVGVTWAAEPKQSGDAAWSVAIQGRLNALLVQFYPGAASTRDEEGIAVTHRVERYARIGRDKTGKAQPPSEAERPVAGGVIILLSLHEGPYAGSADAPQTVAEDGHAVLLLAPQTAAQDRHLLARCAYPSGTDPDFLAAFTAMVGDFESSRP